MTHIPDHAPKSGGDLASFDQRVARVMSDESGFAGTSVTAEPLSNAGEFCTIWQCRDGTIITHRHSWSTGMGHMAKVKAYSDRFGQALPAWVCPMPPMVIWRLCDIALLAEQPLPSDCPELEGAPKTFSRIVAIAEGAARFSVA